MSWLNTIFGLITGRREQYAEGDADDIGTAVIDDPLNVIGLVSGTGMPGSNNGPLLEATFNNPRGIAVDGKENIYIADFNNHVIRRIDAETRLVETFAGTGVAGMTDGSLLRAQFKNPIGLCFDNLDNMYVTDAGNNCVRVINLTNLSVTTLKDPQNNMHTFKYPTDVDVGPANELYIVDYGSNKIFMVKPDGAMELFAGSDIAASMDGMRTMAGFNGPSGIVRNPRDGNIYITEYNGNCIRMINEEGLVSTVAGAQEAGYVDGIGRAARFSRPYHIDVDRNGNMYVADMGNNKLRTIEIEGDNSNGSGSNTITVSTVQVKRGNSSLNSPIGICAGWYSIYISDTDNHMIREIYFSKNAGKKQTNGLEDDPSSMALHGNYMNSSIPTYKVETLAGSGVYGVKDGKGTDAHLGYCRGMALDREGSIYVCDMYNQNIRKITSDGIVTKIAGSGTWGYKDGPAKEAQFMYPNSIAVDDALNLYVCEIYGRIRKISSNGVVSTLAGQYGWGYRDGPGAQAYFYHPYGICVNRSGRTVYVADLHSHRIRAISTQDGVVSTFAGIGSWGTEFKSGVPRLQASIRYPYGIAIDKNDSLYVLEYIGNRVVKISNGIATTFAGNGRPGWKDGPSTEAQFYYAQHISVDDNGYVYVSDFSNNALRRITPDGAVTTLIKSRFWRYRDGLIKDANFSGIMSAVMNNKTNTLYVADWSSHRIRTIKPTSIEMNDVYIKPYIDLDASAIQGIIGRTLTTIPNTGSLEGAFSCHTTRYYSTSDGLRYLHMSHKRGAGFIQYNGNINWNSFTLPDGKPNGVTIFVVAQMNEPSVWARFFDFGTAAGYNNILLARIGTSNHCRAQIFNGHSTAGYSDVYHTIDSQWHVYAVQFRNGMNQHNIRIFKDAFVNKISDRSYNGRLANRVTGKNYIGKSNWNGDQTASMNLRQLSVYDTAMTDTDIQSTMDVLRTKWKI